MKQSFESLARNQQCYMRLPGVCNGNPETTVLAHIRRGNLGGTGLKPVSIFAVPMCFDCHNAYDARCRTKYSRTELDAEALRALGQWLAWLWKEEYLILVAA
jgi:hypothetical protein